MRNRFPGRWRTSAVLAFAAIVGVMLIPTPAGAHFLPSISHIWHHIEPKADARYVRQSTVAWALVNTDGTLVTGRTNGFTAASRPSDDHFCLTPKAGLGLSGKPVIVSVEWGASNGGSLFAYWYRSAADCSAGQIEVITEGGAAPSSVAFSVLVP